MKGKAFFTPVGLLLLGCGLLILAACGGFSFEVKIPKSLIEDQVKQKFPTVKNKGLMTVRLWNPVLDFQGSRNRLGVSANAEVKLLGLVPLRGSMVCDGTLLYKPQTGTFVFTDVKVKKFNIQDLPSSRADEVSGLILSAALSALGGLEIYKLNPEESTEKIAKLALKGIRVRDDGIVVKLGLGQ
jgi:hypothetical protein